MTTLAIEFSSDLRTVAIARDGQLLARAEECGGRNAHAFRLIERALADAKLERESIECLAVGIGPGSYAGIRAAIALAQGWQIANGVRLLGISTVESMAFHAATRGENGRISIAIDAQRNECCLATYELDGGRYAPATPLHLAGVEEVKSISANSRLLVWPELHARFPEALVRSPDAAALCGLASGRTDFVAGPELTPIYLREVSFIKAPPARVIPSL